MDLFWSYMKKFGSCVLLIPSLFCQYIKSILLTKALSNKMK
jgi:hypothetical protein